MRLFVAIDVDDATRHAAERLRARFASQSPGGHRALRWVDPRLLHLTVRFLGEAVGESSVLPILVQPFEQPEFFVTWGRTGWLPPRGRPRVLYVGLERGANEVASLADELANRLTSIGIRKEDRPFTAHLTLARVRDDAQSDLLRLVGPILEGRSLSEDLRVRVSDVVLYESRLSPQGPSYHVRHRSPLR